MEFLTCDFTFANSAIAWLRYSPESTKIVRVCGESYGEYNIRSSSNVNVIYAKRSGRFVEEFFNYYDDRNIDFLFKEF